jgi:hypothetical protein
MTISLSTSSILYRLAYYNPNKRRFLFSKVPKRESLCRFVWRLPIGMLWLAAHLFNIVLVFVVLALVIGGFCFSAFKLVVFVWQLPSKSPGLSGETILSFLGGMVAVAAVAYLCRWLGKREICREVWKVTAAYLRTRKDRICPEIRFVPLGEG